MFVPLVALSGGCAESRPRPVPPSHDVPAPPEPVATAAPPASSPEPSPPAKPSPEMLAKQLVLNLCEATSQHDAKKLAGYYAPDGVFVAAGADPVRGREAIAQNAQRFFDAIATLKVRASRGWVIPAANAVVYEWTLTGTHSGDFKGHKPTEKPIGIMGSSVLLVDADTGLVREEHAYADMGTVMSQIGASKAKGRPVVALATSTEWHVAKGTPEEEKNADAARRLIAALEAKNEADFLALNADDVTVEDMTMPVDAKGKDELKKWFKALTTAIPDLKVTVQNAWGVEGSVIVESTLSGTQKAALAGIPATNKSVILHALDVQEFKDGKLVRARAFGDASELARQSSPPSAAVKKK